MKALNSLAQLQTQKAKINKEQKECLENIKERSTKGRSGFECALGHLRCLLVDLNDKQEEEKRQE